MKFDPEKLEPLATGSEKTIYQHPHDPEKVVAESRYEELGPNPVKQRYYLTKILHMIFPKNIPDISFIRSGKDGGQQMVMERKHLDPAHNELRDLASQFWEKVHGESPVDTNTSDSIADREQEMTSRLENDPNYHNFKGEMEELGIQIDNAPRNFGYDEEGNLIYIDNDFFPLNIQPEAYEKLHDTIQKLEGHGRDRAMAYWSRLNELRKEADEKR